ncbi:hypothetical protein DN508_38135, partial [Burkholderia multivorans]
MSPRQLARARLRPRSRHPLGPERRALLRRSLRRTFVFDAQLAAAIAVARSALAEVAGSAVIG